MRAISLRLAALGLGAVSACLACSANSASSPAPTSNTKPDASLSDGSVHDGRPDGLLFDSQSDAQDEDCPLHCSEDHRSVNRCGDQVATYCKAEELCAEGACYPACEAAKLLRTSVGCDYYPTEMDGYLGASEGGCFAVFVANTWTKPAHIQVSRKGKALDIGSFGYLPIGTGKNLTYEPLDPATGIPAGKVAIYFLAGPDDLNVSDVLCPDGVGVAVKNTNAQIKGTGIGDAFHLESDVPVVAYQMLPYGGGAAAVTGASLLLPTSVWDNNYVAVNAYKTDPQSNASNPSLNIIAMEDNTEVTLLPRVNVEGKNGIASAAANKPLKINLNAGQYAQITQQEELTGSPIQSTKPIGLLAGHECMNVPASATYCDHGEQQIPPVRALASEYVGVSHRPRSSKPEAPIYRIIGAVKDTKLAYDPKPSGAPESINLGDIAEFVATEPFVVKSQDAAHPFILVSYMTGQSTVQKGYGDPDFLRMVPPGQYLNRYVFFTDPSYPETNLVLVREKGDKGFAEVSLDCAGALDGWLPIGAAGRFEYTRFDLSRHDFQAQGKCNNGAHEIRSPQPFGLWIWGWGTPETVSYLSTANVSYAYPAGENAIQLNSVEIPAMPK